ncbi:hypothetical protein PsorP6_010990 [Peronosclerospora sorghi]|uniref:Uncharacterized protein n=1 Tax=Peronosclerospora sorghi TaxID=230839 RepID=A0ACC0VYH6_9STRA|nr:hypothetical protein PsorP6_010990 [Peronosclerospora sorghi]
MCVLHAECEANEMNRVFPLLAGEETAWPSTASVTKTGQSMDTIRLRHVRRQDRKALQRLESIVCVLRHVQKAPASDTSK